VSGLSFWQEYPASHNQRIDPAEKPLASILAVCDVPPLTTPSHLRGAAAGGCEKKRYSLGRALPPAPLAPPSAADPTPIQKNQLT